MAISLQWKLKKKDTSTKILTTRCKRQKEIEQELSFKFIRIDPGKEDFDIFELSTKYLENQKIN